MTTIGQQIKWDFKANGSLEIKDKNGNPIYFESSNGDWSKNEFDSKGNLIYFENSYKFWRKYEYDSQDSLIYWEDSNGCGGDNRPKPYEDNVIVVDGKKYKLVKA